MSNAFQGSNGLTIDGNTNNTQGHGFITLKSTTDVAHGVTDVQDTATWGAIYPHTKIRGGMVIQAITDAYGSGMRLDAIAPGPDSADSTANAYSVIKLASRKTNGTGYGDLADNENAFSVWNNETGRFIIKGDGNIHGDTSAVALDAYDDAALIRATEIERAIDKGIEDQLLPSRFDANQYTKETLEDMNLRAARISDEDWEAGSRPLHSLTNMDGLVKNAVWQGHEMLDALMEAIDAALTDAGIEDNFQQTYVKPRFVARGLPTQILDWDGPIPDELTVSHEPPPAFNA
jgi:hypothetical protein